MRIQSHKRAPISLALISLIMLGCPPKAEQPPSTQSPQEATPREAPTPPPSSKAKEPGQAPPRRAPRARAASAPRDGLHLLRTTGSVEGPLPYTLVAPADGGEALPIVLALHGRGDRAEGFCRLVERLRLPFRFVVAEAPMRWGLGSGKAWFDMGSAERPAQLAARVKDIMTLTEKVHKRWPKAPAPALLGFSQGAMLALQVIATHPERFSGAVALSGSLLEPEGLKAGGASRPILLSAGARDTMVPAVKSAEAAKALITLGHQVELFSFEGAHGVTPPVVTKVRSALSAWFEGAGQGTKTK